jgi:hypothetical protein
MPAFGIKSGPAGPGLHSKSVTAVGLRTFLETGGKKVGETA